MTDRKLQALRNLAERPGTEAEGKVAREMLAKLEAKVVPASEEQTKAYGIPRSDPFDAIFAERASFWHDILREEWRIHQQEFRAAVEAEMRRQAEREGARKRAEAEAEKRYTTASKRQSAGRFFRDLQAKVGQDTIDEVMADIERCKRANARK